MKIEIGDIVEYKGTHPMFRGMRFEVKREYTSGPYWICSDGKNEYTIPHSDLFVVNKANPTTNHPFQTPGPGTFNIPTGTYKVYGMSGAGGGAAASYSPSRQMGKTAAMSYQTAGTEFNIGDEVRHVGEGWTSKGMSINLDHMGHQEIYVKCEDGVCREYKSVYFELASKRYKFKSSLKCECGSDSVPGYENCHSNWCPKYTGDNK